MSELSNLLIHLAEFPGVIPSTESVNLAIGEVEELWAKVERIEAWQNKFAKGAEEFSKDLESWARRHSQ